MKLSQIGFNSACAAILLSAATTAQVLQYTTTFTSDNLQDGNTFNIEAIEAVTISHFDIHLTPGNANVEIYHRPGPWTGVAKDPTAWTLKGTLAVQGAASGVPVSLAALPLNIFIPKGQTHAFYITTKGGTEPNLRYTNGDTSLGQTINSSVGNTDLKVYYGLGVVYPFGQTFKPRLWNGTVYYNRESFKGTPATMSVSAGGTQSWTMTAGTANAGLAYLVLGSVTGTSPGLQLGAPTVVPINFDGYTEFTIVAPNTPPIANGFNFLNASGNATGGFTLPAGVTPNLIGITFSHAYVTIKLEPTLLSLPFASNAIGVTMTP